MSPVLVTGGAGYIGSHCCKVLSARGYLPITYDNLSRGNRSAVKWGALEVGDLGDSQNLEKVLSRYKPIAAIHLAAFAYVGESVEQPLLYYMNNVVGSVNFLRTLHRHGVSKVVFSSTCATYGVPESLPITEEHPQSPINAYGRTKLAIEGLLRDMDVAHGLRSVSLRYFNAAGADPEGEIGEVHDPEPHLIPRVLDVALGRAEYIQVCGTDYPTPDGTCIRDYVHVCDLAEAHVRALDWLLSGGTTLCLNLGSGQPSSVLEVIEMAKRVTRRPIRLRLLPRRPGDPPSLVGDATKARRLLDWQPARSDLSSVIEDAWRWHQRRS